MSKRLVLFLLTLATVRAEDYCFGFLNAHPERRQIPEAQAQAIQKGHMAHLNRMGREGHLLAAGPLLTPGGPRGIVLYRCKSVDEAREWTALDPAVQNKRLVIEVYRWHGPDGMGEPLATMLRNDPSVKVEMTRLPLIVLRKTDKWTGGGPGPILQEHAKAITALLRDGTVRVAGPFVDPDGRPGQVPGMVGVMVLSAMPLEKARELASNDPTVTNGYARVEAYEWLVAEQAIPKP